MLVHLSIHDYAIVEHLDLELSRGMSVITGETGAGKSIMLDALSLALGGRTDSGAVRIGADKAEVLATFDISNQASAQQWLAERDLEQNKQCILRRVISREGRSRAYINGVPCPLSDLKAIGEQLIDIHGQHEHQSLLKTDSHRRLLDEFAGIHLLARQVQQAAQRWRQTKSQLEQLSSSNDEQRARHQLLSYQLEEMLNLELQEGELQQLEQEQQNLASADHLLEQCRFVLNLCNDADSGSILSAINASAQRLEQLKSPPAALEESASLLRSAHIQIEESVRSLERFIDHFDADPERLQAIEQRLDSLYTLARKHRVQPEALLELQEQLSQELALLDSSDEQIEQLEADLDIQQQHYQALAQQLSDKRLLAAEQLSEAVQQEIQRLGMPGGRFAVELTCKQQAEPHPNGNESIEFLVSANPGQPLRPLAKVASGGELSRISLAIQVITAQTSQIPTLVFDEVDVGIGGPTAEIVGQLLRRLGDRGQVLTVTHLPQVAAQGHQHLYVHKKRNQHSTHTAVMELSLEQRIEEVARMSGGVDLSEHALAHARQMLGDAQRSISA